MAKTLKEFKDIAQKIDVFFVLVDARAPISSFIEQFDDLIKNKKVIVLLTKSDLVDQNQLNKFIAIYQKRFEHAYAISLTNKKMVRKKIIKILDGIKFKKLLPKFLILGVPNVGKSTLLNLLTLAKTAKVEDRAGVTKTNTWYQFGKKYWIMDTPGVLEPKFKDDDQGLILAAIGSIKINVLPLEEVSLKLISKIQDKGYEIGFDQNNLEQSFIDHLNSSSKQPHEFYLDIIRNFQKTRYGKIILD